MAGEVPFEIHPRLLADCQWLGRLEDGHLLLHRNSLLPWLILVPVVTVGELFQIPQPLRGRIQEQWDQLARFTQARFGCDKINVAAIGNLVPQLHLHVVGRRKGDPCWPGVVWGRLPEGPPWPSVELDGLVEALEAELGLIR